MPTETRVDFWRALAQSTPATEAILDVTVQWVTLLDMEQSESNAAFEPTTLHAEHQDSGDIDFMPEEDDYKPDPWECQLTDKFIEALMFGDGPLAASVLFELKELDGVAKESLAFLFDDGRDYLFPSRLEFRNKRRGKPQHQPSSDDSPTPEKKLIDALKRGNRTATSALLRGMERLCGEALKLMALLLEDSVKLGPLFPCRLLFSRRRRGRPLPPLGPELIPSVVTSPFIGLKPNYWQPVSRQG